MRISLWSQTWLGNLGYCAEKSNPYKGEYKGLISIFFVDMKPDYYSLWSKNHLYRRRGKWNNSQTNIRHSKYISTVRLLPVKWKVNPFNMAIILFNAATLESTKEEIDNFCNRLETAKYQSRSQAIIPRIRDLNAKTIGKTTI